MLQFRYVAKERLAKATALLSSDDDDDLTYACLELRKCIEALSYEQLTGYLAEVPLKAFEAWQADKVIKELLRVDPRADRSTHIRMREEGKDGKPDGDWIDLGEDRRLDAREAAKAYHQLGSFLHVPTIKQAQKEQPVDTRIIRERANAIKESLRNVLDATVWNANFSVSVTINCSECEAPIKRRSKALESGEDVECGNCGQLFEVKKLADDSFQFIPHSFSWNCAACGVKRMVIQSKMKDGMDVTCPDCKDPATLSLTQSWQFHRRAAKSAAD